MTDSEARVRVGRREARIRYAHALLVQLAEVERAEALVAWLRLDDDQRERLEWLREVVG